jgi:predicted helicase
MLTEGRDIDPAPMRRAVAFCQVIDPRPGAKTHKVSSKQIAAMFQAVIEAYRESEADASQADDEAADQAAGALLCEAEHVDGAMNASEKEARLAWLKAEPPANTCRILSNVRCLSEGVDVPALDAVLFLTPRNSQVDVVQSVGRVMRKAPGKVRGYVVLPVVIPAGMAAHEALNDNRTYKVVWEVLQALRSHDDRFDAMINKLDLIGRAPHKMEVIAITDKAVKKAAKQAKRERDKAALRGKAKAGFSIGETHPAPRGSRSSSSSSRSARSSAPSTPSWSRSAATATTGRTGPTTSPIARTHIARIRAIVEDPANAAERGAFKRFAAELRDDLNDSITDDEVIEMLAQHLITKPGLRGPVRGPQLCPPQPRLPRHAADARRPARASPGERGRHPRAFYASVKLAPRASTTPPASRRSSSSSTTSSSATPSRA